MRLFHPATRLQPATPVMDTAEQLPDRPGPMSCCRAKQHCWGLAASDHCDCGQRQTMGHIVDSCPLTQLNGGLTRLHEADDDAVNWLKTTAATALAK